VSDGSGQVQDAPFLGVTEHHYRFCKYPDDVLQSFGRFKCLTFNLHTIISFPERHYLQTRRKFSRMELRRVKQNSRIFSWSCCVCDCELIYNANSHTLQPQSGRGQW